MPASRALEGPAAPLRVVAHRHRPRDTAVRRVLAAADAVAIGLATAVAVAPGRDRSTVLLVLATLPAWLLLFKAYGLYDRDIKRISKESLKDLPAIVHSLLLGSVLLWIASDAVLDAPVGRTEILVFAIAAAATMLVLRTAGRTLAARLLGRERILLAGDAQAMPLLARKLRAHPEYGVEAVGVLSNLAGGSRGGLPVLGRCDPQALAAIATAQRVERVVIAHADGDVAWTPELVRAAQALGLKVSLLPHPFDALGRSAEVDDVEGVTLLGLHPPVLPRSSRFLKRTMDLAGAAVLLVVAVPVLLAAAVAVKVTSPGPVLFRQERIGRAGRRFRLAKFRTMVVGADAMTAALAAQSSDPNWLLLADDPRVTRVGRFLRTTSIDELPQLWNVLRGEMSLVGPRPLVENEDRQITGWGRGRLDLTPGLTGLWQVLGRTSIPFEEMITLDYVYVTNWSLWGDVQILLRTLPAMLTRRGAN
jgi:exopolysaccharide biosynthesis polyprenyl glycosylphosphotransferase